MRKKERSRLAYFSRLYHQEGTVSRSNHLNGCIRCAAYTHVNNVLHTKEKSKKESKT